MKFILVYDIKNAFVIFVFQTSSFPRAHWRWSSITSCRSWKRPGPSQFLSAITDPRSSSTSTNLFRQRRWRRRKSPTFDVSEERGWKWLNPGTAETFTERNELDRQRRKCTTPENQMLKDRTSMREAMTFLVSRWTCQVSKPLGWRDLGRPCFRQVTKFWFVLPKLTKF